MQSGVVFNIQRFSVHDGPGIRTTVFLKGCTLRCFWCHNPESVLLKPELQLNSERCIACGNCLAACKQGAHKLTVGATAIHTIDRSLCLQCGDCAKVCYSQALTMAGETMTSERVVEECLRDRAFYGPTGGGVTLSGGEPALQAAFSAEILQKLKAEGVHTCVETAANVPWSDLALLLEQTDLVLLDIKLIDEEKHRQAVGASNRRILENARRISELGIPIVPRVPVVPGVNDNDEEITAIARFASELATASELTLLPFHRLADSKYQALGKEHRAAALDTPTQLHLESLARSASNSSRLSVKIG